MSSVRYLVIVKYFYNTAWFSEKLQACGFCGTAGHVFTLYIHFCPISVQFSEPCDSLQAFSFCFYFVPTCTDDIKSKKKLNHALVD